MRSVSASLENAINQDTQRSFVKARLYKTRNYFTAFDTSRSGSTHVEDAAWSTQADLHPQSFVVQQVASPVEGCRATWYRDINGLLAYQTGHASTFTSTTVTVLGNPSAYDNYVFVSYGASHDADNTTIRRYQYNWGTLSGHPANPFSANVETTSGSNVVGLYAVSTSKVVAMHEKQATSNRYRQIWPAIFNYNGSTWDAPIVYPGKLDFPYHKDNDVDLDFLMNFVAAVEFGNRVFLYWSNPSDGAIYGLYYDSTTGWSDQFKAIPIDKEASLCELRVTDAYVLNSKINLVVHFRREDSVTDAIYNLIMPSGDGVLFSMEKDTLVSSLGYRLQADTDTDGTVYLGNCNKLVSFTPRYLLSGGSSLEYIDVPAVDIIAFNDQNLTSATLQISNGSGVNTSGSNAPYLEQGNLVKVFFGLESGSSGGIEYIDWGWYNISAVSRSLRDGGDPLVIGLTSTVVYRLEQGALPFYTEFTGKQLSVIDLTSEDDQGYLYNAGVSSLASTQLGRLSIDFWKMPERGFTGDVWALGMPDPMPAGIYENGGPKWLSVDGQHDYYISSPDIKNSMELDDYPVLTTNGQITAYLHGWSHPISSGSAYDPDIVELGLFLRAEDGTEAWWWSNKDLSFRATYPTDSGNTPPYYTDEIPIVVTGDAGLVAGMKIIRCGMRFASMFGTHFMAARVDFYQYVSYKQMVTGSSLPWERQLDGSGVMMKGSLVPQIMFSQDVYDAREFRVSATFTESVDSIPWDGQYYPLAYGLVGHASDAYNYWAFRYNKAWCTTPDSGSGFYEIVQVVEGFENLRASADGETVGSVPYSAAASTLTFEYRDGNYIGYLTNPANGNLLQEVIRYASNSDIVSFGNTRGDAPSKVGLYGVVCPPAFRLASNYSRETENDYPSSDVFAVFPGDNTAFGEFPATGTVVVGDGEYIYSSKVTKNPRNGPYPYIDAKYYSGLEGDGKAGVRIMMFDYALEGESPSGAIAREDGAFISNGVKSDVYGGGSDNNKLNSLIWYSANKNVAQEGRESERVYITSYLSGLSVSIDGGYLKRGDWCYVKYTGWIKCQEFRAFSVAPEETVQTLSEKITKMVGATISFPGDTIASDSSASHAEKTLTTIEYAEAVDFLATVTSFATNDTLKLRLNGLSWTVPDTQSGLSLWIKRVSTGYEAWVVDTDGTTLEKATFTRSFSSSIPIRVYAHGEFISLYICGVYIHTWAHRNATWGASTIVVFSATNNAISYRIPEISDYREAVFIDLESSGEAGLSSVVQERPLERSVKSDGSMALSYYPTRTTVSQTYKPRALSVDNSGINGVFSDYIIYGKINTGVYQDADSAALVGIKTKVVKVPNLDNGAVRAVKLLALRAYQNRIRFSRTARYDMRIEMGDMVSHSYSLPNGESYSATMIVDGVTLSTADGGMSVDGRLYAIGVLITYNLDFSVVAHSMYIPLM